MKKISIAIAVFLVLVIATALVAPGFIDWSKYRQQIEAQVEASTGHQLSIGGKIHFALLPSPSLFVEDITLLPSKAEEPVLKLKRINVDVSIRKLLEGDIIVQSLRLQEPRIYVRVDENGQPNWMSQEIKALLEGRAASADAESGAAKKEGLMEAVSLESVRIENGTFIFVDDRSATNIEVSSVDLSLKGDNVLGPYNGEGKLVFHGEEIKFQASTGRIDNLESIALQLKTSFPKRQLSSRFSGVLALKDAPEVQGEIAFDAAKIEAVMPGAPLSKTALQKNLSVKGLLTASKSTAVLDNARVAFGDLALNGTIDVSGLDKAPLKAVVTLNAERHVNLDEWLAPRQGTAPKASVSFLPESITLPLQFTSTAKLTAPKVTYMGKTFENFQANVTKEANTFNVVISAADGPGNASVNASAKLAFASGSAVKGGGVVLSDPKLALDVRLVSGNIANLVTPFLPPELSQMAALRLYDEIDADISASIEPRRIALSETVVKLDQTTFGLSGSYVPAMQPDKKDRLVLQVVADDVNINKLVNRLQQNGKPPPATAHVSSKVDIGSLVKMLALPLDVEFDVSAQKILYKDMPVGAVRLKGSVVGDTLALNTASIGDFFGGKFSASGKIGDTRQMQDIDLTLSGQAKNLEAVLDALKIDASALPRPFGSLVFQADIVGNDQALGFKTNVKALKGTVDASGQLTDMLTKPKINSLIAAVEHPNFVEAVRILQPGFKSGPGLEKPIDFYAKIDRTENLYTLSEMKANIGPMPVVGDLTMSTAGVRPLVQGALRFGTVPLGDFFGSGPKGGAGESAGTNVRWSRNAIKTEWMHSFDLDLKIEAKALSYDRWSFVAPRSTVKLAEGVLSVPDFESGLFGGGIKAQGQVRSGKDPRQPVSLETSIALNQVAADSFLHALTGSQIVTAQGTADMTTQLKASGISPAAMIVDLSGQGTLHTDEFILKGVDLARFSRALSEETKPGDTVTGLWKGATRGGQTKFDTVDGKFVVRQGVVHIEPLVLDGPEVAVNASGNINLPRWTINLRNLISFKDAGDVPPFEVTIDGPLDNPGQTFGKGLLEGYLQRKLSRKAQEVLGDKVGEELGGQFGEALGKALGVPGLGGQKPKQQQQAPANDNPQQNEQQQQQQEVRPEDVFQGILKELVR